MLLRELNVPDDTTEAGESDMDSHPSMPGLQAASDDEDDEFYIQDDNYDSVLMTSTVASLNGEFMEEIN